MKAIVFSLALLAAFSMNAGAQKKAPAAPAAKKKPAPTAPATPPATPAGMRSLQIGDRIPNEGLPMMSTDNRPVTLVEAKTTRGLLVMFSCNTCPYVIKAQPKTLEAITYAKRLGIGMVIVNSNEAQRSAEDSPEAMKAYAEGQQYSVPYVRDDASMMANAFGATRTPEVFLFDGNGKLVYKGALEDNPAEPSKSKMSYAAEAMRALSENKPINPAETKSIGCGIKRM